jgi:UDP-glucose 4-epimerase
VFRRARREGKPLTIHGDGEQTRDFTHVDDVVRANLLAMDCAVADGRAINVGGGRNISINRVAELIGGPTVYLPARLGDARHTLADIGEAQRTLGWRPEVKFEDGLASLIRMQGL